jgi:glycosyltransferase involved in cell wall biosynthesis
MTQNHATRNDATRSDATRNDAARNAMARKAVHVSTVHPATDVRVFHKECRSLAAAGYDVVLYARTDTTYTDSGVRVCPVPAGRSRLARMTTGVWRLLLPLLRHRADVYHLHDPELVPLGLLLRVLGRTVVFDAHEVLPSQVLGKYWIPARLRPAVGQATRLVMWLAGRGLSAVVAAAPVVADSYAGARRMVVVNNYPIHLARPDIPYAERSRDLVYVGGISDNRGLSSMLEAARIVRARHGAKLTLVGPFQPAELADRLDEPGVTDAVDYVGVTPPEEARELVGTAKVGLLLLIGTKAYENTLPTKIFEYMAEGLPVIASDVPLWKRFLDETGAGVVVPADDGAAAGAAAARLLADPAAAAQMGERGRQVAAERFSWETEAQTLLALYDRLLPPATDGPAPTGGPGR